MGDCSSPSCSTSEDADVVAANQPIVDKSPYVASRRRLAFRPQGVKIKHIAAAKSISNKNLANVESESRQTVSEKEGPFKQPNLMMSPSSAYGPASTSLEPEQKSKRRLHGKDFDSVAKYMNKKKINKDKEQIRNYYFNAFKIWKAKALIEEADWTNVPRDARELFVVLNGCEWKKRTCAANFDPVKFKYFLGTYSDGGGPQSVIITNKILFHFGRAKSPDTRRIHNCEGQEKEVDDYDQNTIFNPKKPKTLNVFLPLGYCPCLLKWIQTERGRILNDKRNTEIPTHLSLKLTPFCYKDRNYVTSCEQNPLLQIQININDKISSVFSLLERKWISSTERIRNEFDVDGKKPLVVRLRVAEGVSEGTGIHKVLVDVNDDSFPMSLNKLKRDYEVEAGLVEAEELPSTSNGGIAEKTVPPMPSVKRQKDGGTIKLSSKEVFDIDEAKIKEGLTKENVANASLLQLFYLCGMKTEMVLSYEICHQQRVIEPWSLFVSLINRDYGELMSKTLTCSLSNNVALFDGAYPSTSAFHNTEQPQDGDVFRKKKGEKTIAGKDVEHTTNIVEEENMQFLQQLKNLNNQHKKPKRQVKLLPNNQVNKRFCSPAAGVTTQKNQSVGTVNYTHANSYITTVQPDNPHQPITYLIAAQNYPGVCLQPVNNTTYLAPVSNCQPITTIQQPDGTLVAVETQAPIDFSHFPDSSTQPSLCVLERGVVTQQNAMTTSAASYSAGKAVEAHQKRATRGAERECEIAGEFSIQSIDSSLSSFAQPIILDSSPSKTLPDDVRHAYEQMLKENSVDYCRNFEQLTRNLDTMHKSTALGSTALANSSKQ